ncbi:hypothetical protein [Nocardioides sp. NPDC127503]|uniref:hypothetical protein n=1 Tax=Nocardioides sp. NPDC127503 TaxID=3154516 RepID=UPI00332121C3
MFPAEVPTSEASFRRYVEWLIRRHSQEVSTLEGLVRVCQGAYPTMVQSIAQRLMMSEPGAMRPNVLLQSSSSTGDLAAAASRLPLPHPLDFEWRFSTTGCRAIGDFLEAAARPGEAVALLGTPGLAEHFARLNVGGMPTLFERRDEACAALESISSLEVVRGSLHETSHAHAGRFAAAVADPPWYREISEVFLLQAARLLIPGGVLLFCAPALATRPGLPGERAHLTAVALAAGLVLERVEPSQIQYESPPFEIAALAAAGMPRFDCGWRHCDLLQFRRMPTETDSSPAQPNGHRENLTEWREVQVGRGRIRIDLSPASTAESSEGPLLASVVPGDVLDSVSNRDPRRVGVNVWTTTNRVFRTRDPAALLAGLHAVAGLDGASGVPTKDEHTVAATELIEQEIRLLRSIGIE